MFRLKGSITVGDVVKVEGFEYVKVEDEDDTSVFEDESRGAEVNVWTCAIEASPELEECR